jgi:hypothetical protein
MASSASNQRGEYGTVEDADRKSSGAGSVLLVVGLAVGIYALSPGARYFYKHGHLPPYRP